MSPRTRRPKKVLSRAEAKKLRELEKDLKDLDVALESLKKVLRRTRILAAYGGGPCGP